MAAMTDVLAGRYTLERIVGEGGMARVWRARDSRLDRPVAVKIMSERITNDPEFRARFMQEARAAASFSHANIVDVLDYGEEDGVPYIVMELVEGDDLRALLERERKLPADEVARIGAGIARGLAAAHRRGLIHRDIKPANILLDSEGTPKLTDFGIVRALGTATQTKAGTTFGSVHYLSPEQVQGGAVDARSDLYSLGVVLYEAATGERPFDGDAPAAIAVRRLSETPRPPHAVEPTLPPWLSAVIERAMSREPERRYRTATELEQDLQSHRATAQAPFISDATVGMPVPVTSPRAIQRARPARPRRRSILPFLLAVAVALAFIGLGLFFLLGARGTIAIPNVIGHERDTAAAELRAAGFANPTILGPDPNPMERGKIYRQDPQPGTRLPPDATVTIYWSDGPGSVPVPSLRNRTLAEAKSVLEAVGLKLGSSMDQFDPFVAVGRVISSDPASGISVPQGFTVDVILSRGPQPTPTPAPTPSPTPSPTPTRTLPLP